MTKEGYMQAMELEPKEIELTDADVRAWLNNMVDALHAAKDAQYELAYGKLNEDEGEYENIISPCHNELDFTSIHIYKGIIKLATIMGEELQTQYIKHTEVFEHFFMWRGVKVFELCDTGKAEDLR